MIDFKNKLVVVTGSARGIGKAVAFQYAKEGARVILLDILSDQLNETAAELKAAGHTGYAFKCDLASDEGVAALGAQIIKDIGVPDIIHNNAFWAASGVIEDLDISAIKKSLDISVLGYLRVIKAFINEMMVRKSGWIVNTASPNGITPAPASARFFLPYSLCKAADISLSQSLVSALKDYNIGVSVVFPGPVLTGQIEENTKNASEEFRAATLKYFEEHGSSPEQAAIVFLEGIRNEQFLVTNYPNFSNILIEYAKKGLDPTAVDMSVFGH